MSESDHTRNEPAAVPSSLVAAGMKESMKGSVHLEFQKRSVKHGASKPNRALRIGIDARCLAVRTTRLRGIGRYVTNLVLRMAEQAPQDQFVLLGNDLPWDRDDHAVFRERPNVRYQGYCRGFHRELDVLLLTDPLPVLCGRPLLPFDHEDLPLVSIIYDLIPLEFPERYLAPNCRLHQEYIERLHGLATHVSRFLPISDFVARELEERLGTPRDLIRPIYGGLDEVFEQRATPEQVEETRRRHALQGDYFVYAGGFDYRKNLDALLASYARLVSTHPDSRLVIVGDGAESQIAARIQMLNLSALSEHVVATGFVSDQDLKCLMTGARALIFPSLYEGFGLPALEAMACGCPVIASNSSSLKEIVDDAGILIDPRSIEDIHRAMRDALEDMRVVVDCRNRGPLRAERYTWHDVAERTRSAIQEIAAGQRQTAPSRKLRVMVQNRATAFSARGGDTELMGQLYRSLRNRDVEVEVGTGRIDLSGFDLLHLMNITLPAEAEQAIANADAHRVPLVVTTLFEDWPRYLDKSVATVPLFEQYLLRGGSRDQFDQSLDQLRRMPPCTERRYDALVKRADALLVCGEAERDRLHREYPTSVEKTHITHFAVNNLGRYGAVGVEQFKSALGVDEFVLCCGRLETRKNQLMLIRALEDTGLPIVLACGDFSAQPEYVRLVEAYAGVRPVKLLGRVDEEILATLMSAATVHALPSWYELPGLVTLEAATCGTPVVASDWGGLCDYLPRDLVHVCSPEDPDSIRTAIMEARNSTPDLRLREAASVYTLERFAEETLEAYDCVRSRRQRNPSTMIHSLPTEQTITNSNLIPAEDKVSTRNHSKSFDVSIIIPVYNQAELTRQCLEALCADEPSVTYEVIVVDNHSTDETPEILSAIEGDFKTIRESENRGFGTACNRGARIADGKYLVLLNNDTVPQRGWLNALVDCAQRNPDAGAIGARMTYPNGRIQHAGIAFRETGCPYNLFQSFEAEHDAVMEQRDMQAVSAACMLIPAATFSEVGGLDEGYVNGFEDVDFCLRLGQMNRRIVYCPKAHVIHHEESTEGRKDHDLPNLERFLARWKDTIRCDEQEYCRRFGLRIDWNEHSGTYRPLDAEQDQDETPNADALLDEASKLYVAGNYNDAAERLQQIVENRMTLGSENGFEVWQTLGNCLARLDRAEEAENAYLEAVRLNNKSERPYLGLGSVAMLQRNWTAAQYGFMAALERNPETTRGEFGVGISLAARERHADALAHFRNVVNREPDNAEALFYLYKSAMESDQPETAIEPLIDYAESHPTDTDFLFNLSGALWKAGEPARAIDVCRQLLEMDPENTRAREALEHMSNSLAEDA